MPRKKKEDKDVNSEEKDVPRNAANARERTRMRILSKAFGRLKLTLPWVPPDTKLSKLDTLRLAMSYITHLKRTLDQPDDTEHTQSNNKSWPYLEEHLPAGCLPDPEASRCPDQETRSLPQTLVDTTVSSSTPLTSLPSTDYGMLTSSSVADTGQMTSSTAEIHCDTVTSSFNGGESKVRQQLTSAAVNSTEGGLYNNTEDTNNELINCKTPSSGTSSPLPNSTPMPSVVNKYNYKDVESEPMNSVYGNSYYDLSCNSKNIYYINDYHTSNNSNLRGLEYL